MAEVSGKMSGAECMKLKILKIELLGLEQFFDEATNALLAPRKQPKTANRTLRFDTLETLFASSDDRAPASPPGHLPLRSGLSVPACVAAPARTAPRTQGLPASGELWFPRSGAHGLGAWFLAACAVYGF